jgi:hypothetical protein
VTAPEPVTIVERPPAGPARGALAAPVWLVVLLAAALLLLSCLVLLRAWRRRTK